MKNSNEGNKKIVPLSDEELQQATGGKTKAEFYDEICEKIDTRYKCLQFKSICGWFQLKKECHGRMGFPVPDLLE